MGGGGSKADYVSTPMEPDPGRSQFKDLVGVMIKFADFGWRQIWAYDAQKRIVNLSSQQMLPEFANDRTGQTCTVALVTLSLNVARRAAILAERFGLFSSEHTPAVDEEHKIYTALNCPEMGWRLLDREYDLRSVGGPCGCRPKVENKTRSKSAANSKDAEEAGPVSRLIQSGMNLHEQLLRLEKRATEQHTLPMVSSAGYLCVADDISKSNSLQSSPLALMALFDVRLPQDSFGWSPTGLTRKCAVQVQSPRDDEMYWVIPEELIMNMNSWIQVTYYTQPPSVQFNTGGK